MTGADHYREAERLIDPDYGRDVVPNPVDDPVQLANRLALAQVHASLALAFATALPLDSGWRDLW